MDCEKSFEIHLRDLILEEVIDSPLVFKGIHKEWEPCKWNVDDWGNLFNKEKLTVRYGKQKWENLQPQWESDCGKQDMTWKEIIDWIKGEYTFLPENGSPEDVWVYYDYKYLPDIFQLKSSESKDFLKLIYFNENLKKKFSWSKLGFPDRNGDHSTLWCGTSGSYTPCHFDTYSCNLVCQVMGRKTWLLFPPKDVENLQPTRVPYEESSVYSKINFASSKRVAAHLSDLQKCTPFKITLEAGDCLYLPPKWWHFVKSDEFSISVNTWIELPGDHLTRVEEAVLRSVTSGMVNITFPDATKRLLNPNEIDLVESTEDDVNEVLQAAASAYIETQGLKVLKSTAELERTEAFKKDSSCSSKDDTEEPQYKRLKINKVTLKEFLERYSSKVQTLPNFSFESLDCCVNNSDNSKVVLAKESDTEDRSPTYLEHLVNAIGHPSVLRQISSQFLLNLYQNPPK